MMRWVFVFYVFMLLSCRRYEIFFLTKSTRALLLRFALIEVIGSQSVLCQPKSKNKSQYVGDILHPSTI